MVMARVGVRWLAGWLVAAGCELRRGRWVWGLRFWIWFRSRDGHAAYVNYSWENGPAVDEADLGAG
jgi:hypothetical protein